MIWWSLRTKFSVLLHGDTVRYGEEVISIPNESIYGLVGMVLVAQNILGTGANTVSTP